MILRIFMLLHRVHYKLLLSSMISDPSMTSEGSILCLIYIEDNDFENLHAAKVATA